MTDKEKAVVAGGLFHEIGLLAVRGGMKKPVAEAGYYFVKQDLGIEDEEILSCMILPQNRKLKHTSDHAVGYLITLADRITMDMQKQKKREKEEQPLAPLGSIFQHLNGNTKACYLHPVLGAQNVTQDPILFEKKQYQEMLLDFKNYVSSGMLHDLKSINVLLNYLEEAWTTVPAAAGDLDVSDVSLYEHVKFTTAVAICLMRYFQENCRQESYASLFKRRNEWNQTDVFLLLSMDVSGIQNFIYTISTDGALKSLRARSFYLEIMMEHLIDEILEELDLPRTNLLYSGGGHCYMLLPNTDEVLRKLEAILGQVSQWLLQQFQTDLFLGAGYYPCSPDKLRDVPEGSYKECFQNVSRLISEKKICRYSSDQIQMLNRNARKISGDRECRICKRTGKLNKENECSLCASLIKVAKDILTKEYFSIIDTPEENALPLPNGKYLISENEEEFERRRADSAHFIRSYCKNKVDLKHRYATTIWIGSYAAEGTLGELAEKADGIDRIAVFRADVDNLGTTFVSGFSNGKTGASKVTLVRNSVLSRQLSWFFKYYLNTILEDQNVIIVYSGGDDLFIAGAWDAVIDTAVKIYQALKDFTQGALSISGGIGIYPPDYPVRVIAQETAALEDAAKSYDNGKKNAITLFHTDFIFHWDTFMDQVYGEKYRTLKSYFKKNDKLGKSFLYKLLMLLRERNEKINFARYVYLLSRMEPDKNSTDEERENYHIFSSKLYDWMNSEEDSVQLIAAIYLYIYEMRKDETI